MIIKMMLFGYDRSAVDTYLLEIESRQRQEQTELLAQCQAQSERNRELGARLAFLSEEMEQARLAEKEILDRLGEQLKTLQEVYDEGCRMVEKMKLELHAQEQYVEGKKQLLGQWMHFRGR